MVENSHLMMSKWHRVLELVQDLEQEEVVHEHLHKVEPDQPLFEKETPSMHLPISFGSILKQPTNNLGDLTPTGVLHGEGLDPTTEIEPLDEQLVMALMEQSVEKPLPTLVDCDNTAQLSFDDRLVTMKLVVWKQR
jgi:hypothetical protein